MEHLFIVVPGLGGSVLERDGRPVWGGTRQLGRRLWSPDALELAPGDGVRAVGAIGDWRLLPGLVALRGYQPLVATIENVDPAARTDDGHPDRPNPGARIVVFPYDFRRSIVQTAEALDEQVRTRLSHLCGSSDAAHRRVVIVAHSLGGLVARYWIARFAGAARVTRHLITLGTPHRGAPKALDVVANGLRVGPVRLPERHSDVVRGWPSVHELLGRYRAVAQGAGGAYPCDVLTGDLAESADRAFATHTEIERGWGNLGTGAPGLMPVVGMGEATFQQARFDAHGALVSSKESPSWLNLDDLAGDGTVPAVSAVPIEMGDDRGMAAHRRVLGLRHTKLPCWDGLGPELTYLLTGATTHVRGTAGPVIGLDVDDAAVSDAPLRVAARVHLPPEPGETTLRAVEDVTRVQLRTRDAGGAQSGWVDGQATEGWWATDLPPAPAGPVTVEARAVTASGNDPPNRRQRIESVDREDLL